MNHLRKNMAMVAAMAAVAAWTGAWGQAAPGSSTAPAGRKPAAVTSKVELTTKAAADERRAQVAHIRLEGAVLSSPPGFSLFALEGAMTLRDWLERLAKARNDDRVSAVALEVAGVQMSWADAQELADGVRRLAAVKPVYAHLTEAGAVPYLVASAARELGMEPAGTLMITGLGAELMFYRGTLDWLGVKPQIIQIGRYKGAAEPFTHTQPSGELRQEFDKILDDLYEQLCQQIAQQRRLTVPHVKHVIDQGPLAAQAAREYRMVDALVCRADWLEGVLKRAGKDGKPAEQVSDYGRKPRRSIDLANPLQLFSLLMSSRPEQEVLDPTVAIIHADGILVPGRGGDSILGDRMVGADTLASCFEQVAKDGRIKAVIFRIDSPGGSALASELVYQAARKCGQTKPVIASIAQVGGSGGYYIALGGQKILGDPAGLTGSIGVISGKLAITGLLDKLGISTYAMTRGRNAGLWLNRPWDQREQEVVRKLAQQTYDTFVDRVTASRGKRIKDIQAVVQGRIFTARQAAANGLIDEVGGLREALIAAHAAARIDHSYILNLPRPRTLIDLLYGDLGASMGPADAARRAWPPPPAGIDAWRELAVQAPGVLAADGRKAAGLAYLLQVGQLLSAEPVLTAMPYYISVQP